MYVNQIFELSMMLDNERFHKILNKAYRQVGHLDNNENEYIDQSMASKGIVIKYRDSQHKKKIRLIADYKVVLNSSEINSDKFIRKLDKRIGEYFDHKYQLEDFAVARMVLTTDIDVRGQENVSAYLKVLQRIGRVKGFSPASYDCFDTGDSFCLEGNSNGIQFLIYDLENLLESQLGRTDIGRKKLKLIIEKSK